jgi:uncharacterized protein
MTAGAATTINRAPQPYTLPHAETFDLTSKTGDDYRISVSFPASYAESGRRYPVLYVLDADVCFCTTLEICRERGRGGEISEVIAVGVGYPAVTDYATWWTRRLFDYSEAVKDRTLPSIQTLEQWSAEFGQTLQFGGAPRFLDLLTDEVQSLVNERYRTNPNDQGIIGHSAAGAFVVRALFQRPTSFTKYVAGSPALTMSDEFVFDLEADYARTHDDLPVTLYLAAASAEALQMAGAAIVSGTARMAETLEQRNYPGLALTCEMLPGKTHGSVYTDILHRGLEVCWPGTPSSFRPKTPANDALF